MASNFWELGKHPNCLWMKLEDGLIDGFEFEFQKDNLSSFDHIIRKFIFESDEELIWYFHDKCKKIDFITILKAIKKIMMKSKGMEFYRPLAFMGGYKPVYFLLT